MLHFEHEETTSVNKPKSNDSMSRGYFYAYRGRSEDPKPRLLLHSIEVVYTSSFRGVQSAARLFRGVYRCFTPYGRSVSEEITKLLQEHEVLLLRRTIPMQVLIVNSCPTKASKLLQVHFNYFLGTDRVPTCPTPS